MLNLQCYYFLPEEQTRRARNARSGHVEAPVSAVFLIGYGTVRFIAEFFREPDAGASRANRVKTAGKVSLRRTARANFRPKVEVVSSKT